MPHQSLASLLGCLSLLLMLTGCGGDDDDDDDDDDDVVTLDPQPGAAGLGDSLYPGFGNGGYQVEHYTLDITVSDVATSTLSGLTTLEVEATQDLSSFNLDFINMTVDEIRVNGQLASFSRDGQELTINPAEALASGERFSVSVAYNGSPEQIVSVAIPVLTGWVIYDGGSFVLSEPDGAANYYPNNDHPLDKASYTFRITVPKPFEVAANGVLTETADNGTSTTYVFEARDPMPPYLTTVNIDEFDLFTEVGPGNLPIRNYFPADIDPAYRVPFARQAEILAFFEERFGIYPFEVYGVVMVGTPIGGALESQTLSIFGQDDFYLDFPLEAELIVVHEIAHQWIGNSVAVADWRDIWINEGFASYAEYLWVEATQGLEVLNERIAGDYDFVANDEDAILTGNPPADDLFNFSGVYLRPALMLHALRLDLANDEVFFAITRTYAQRFENGNAGREELFAVAEELSGLELDDFFNAWLFDPTLPAIPQLNLPAESVAMAGASATPGAKLRIHGAGRWSRPQRY